MRQSQAGIWGGLSSSIVLETSVTWSPFLGWVKWGCVPWYPHPQMAPCRLSLFPALPHGCFLLFPFKILTPPHLLFMATKQEHVGNLWALCLKKGRGKSSSSGT